MRRDRPRASDEHHPPGPLGLVVQGLTSVYGGFFGAGMGIMMLAVFALLAFAGAPALAADAPTFNCDYQPSCEVAPGVARTSLAGQAAARLGVTGDQLMALIERRTSPSSRRPLVLDQAQFCT